MKPLRTDSHHRSITTTGPLPKVITRARRWVPATPPVDPMGMWVLITETRDFEGKVRRFEAEPLFPGPVEQAHLNDMELRWTTKVTGKIGHHPATGDQVVIYQVIETKPSWQRHGVATELLLRLQDRLNIYGRPVLEAADSPGGKALARSLEWETINPTLTPPHLDVED